MVSQSVPDQMFAEAVQLHRSGKLGPAIRLYEKVARKAPLNAAAFNLLGLARFQAGQLEDAARALQKAIALNAGLPDVYYNLGTILQGLGRYGEAVQSYERALAAKPNDVGVLNNLGAALKALGRYEEAIEQYRRALTLQPGFADAQFNLANALESLDRYSEAADHYRKAIALRSDFAEAHANLGGVLRQLGRPDEALSHCQRAVDLKPGDASMQFNLANVLQSLGRYREAEERCRFALAARPEFLDAQIGLARALRGQGRHSDALALCDQSIVGDPNRAALHCARADLLTELGRFEEARSAYEKAIELDPRNVEAYFGLTAIGGSKLSDTQLAAMQDLARDETSLRESARVALHFALGKALAAAGERVSSFEHFRIGNALKRQRIHYDEAETLQWFDQIRTVFDRGLVLSKSGQGDPSRLPIFVTGMPRSGTTLIEQILASHPKAFGAGELTKFPEAAARVFRPTGRGFPEALTAASGEKLRQLGSEYVKELRALAPDAERVTDKSLMSGQYAGLIHLALPDAKIIYVQRDPVDTCVSCFMTLFETGQAFTHDLAELGRYYRAYESLMAHWQNVLPSGVMLEVRYEDVIADLETQARRIVAHCGLEWDDACLAFHETERPVRTASVAQVRQPVYRSSIGRWRGLEKQLRPLLEALGN